MTEPAFTFMAPLTVCIDFRHPQAYLAIPPTCALIDRLAVAVDWVPRLIEPAPVREAPTIEDRGARHRRLRAEYIARDLVRYGSAVGIGDSTTHPTGTGVTAALGLLRARAGRPDRCTEFVVAMFRAVWREGQSVDDTGMVAGKLADIGVDAAGFENATHDLDEIDAQLRASGVLNVPTFLVDGEPFLGRAHLPMVEWILRGRNGPGPI